MATAYKKLIMVPTPRGTFGISPSNTTIWKPHAETGLTCHHARNWKGEFSGTSAGVYCLTDPTDPTLDGYAGDLVELWISGLIAPYTKGYRAEKAVVTKVIRWSFDLGASGTYIRGENPKLVHYVMHYLQERKKITPAIAMQRYIDGDTEPMIIAIAECIESWDQESRNIYRSHFGDDNRYIKSLAISENHVLFLTYVREHGSAFENYLEHAARWINGDGLRATLLEALVPGTVECIVHDPKLSSIAMTGKESD